MSVIEKRTICGYYGEINKCINISNKTQTCKDSDCPLLKNKDISPAVIESETERNCNKCIHQSVCFFNIKMFSILRDSDVFTGSMNPYSICTVIAELCIKFEKRKDERNIMCHNCKKLFPVKEVFDVYKCPHCKEANMF